MDRIFRFSTFGVDSSTNAALALEDELDLTPISDELLKSGVGLPASPTGYVWGLRAGSSLLKGRPVEAGDFGARLERPGEDVVVTKLYEVLAIWRDRPDVPGLLGIEWSGGGDAGWPVTVVFGQAAALSTHVNYADLRTSYGWPGPGLTWAGVWVPGTPEKLFAISAASSGDSLSPSRTLVVHAERSEALARKQRSRPNQAKFKAAVLVRYGQLCGACDITGRALLDAAHLVDEGYTDDIDDVGLPLCPNHHRLLDAGRLRLRSDLSWELQGDDYKSTVTMPDLSHLKATPHADAVEWKYQRSLTKWKMGSLS